MASERKVTRIKATETPKKATKAVAVKKTADKKTPKQTKKTPGILRPFVALGEYFKGAWFELKQVRWPTRRATWGLTVAVLLFSAFFIVFIVLLDLLFQHLFELLIR